MSHTPTESAPIMTGAPERIWAYYSNVFGTAWSSYTDDGATEYLRADIAAARVNALQAEVARLRSLIGRYINHVGELEGTYFLPGPFGLSELLTDAEIAELSELQKEAKDA